MARKNTGRNTRPKIASPIEIYDYDHDDSEYILNNPYECCACGRRFSDREDNFLKSPSFLFGANNGYVPICIDCSVIFLDHFAASIGMSEAMKRLCERFDLYYDAELIGTLMDSGYSDTRDILMCYMRDIPRYKLFEDSIRDNPAAFRKPAEQDEAKQEKAEPAEPVIADEVIERWGEGFSSDDYRIMEEHYHMLKRQNPNCNSNQEIFIKDLCPLFLMKLYAERSKDADDFKKLSETYRATFKEAGLQTKVETNDGLDSPLGVTIGMMAQFAPEYFYKDKTLYKDFDGLDDYCQRHIFRPLKNLTLGTDEDDPVYHVSPGDENE